MTKRCVLVVDDARGEMRLLHARLVNAGHVALLVSGVGEAVRALAQIRADVVVLDPVVVPAAERPTVAALLQRVRAGARGAAALEPVAIAYCSASPRAQGPGPPPAQAGSPGTPGFDHVFPRSTTPLKCLVELIGRSTGD